MKVKISYLVIVALVLIAFGCQSPESSITQRPNILFLVADDLGYEKLSCYGGLNTQTPNLDRMAAQGTRFTRAYASPVCTPSRMSIYTGTYVPRHQYVDVLPVHIGTRDFVDFTQRPTYAQLLRAAGYATSVTGKWQLAALEFHPDHCASAGFDSWCVWQIWKEGKKTTRYWDPTYNQDGHIREDAADKYGPDLMRDYVIGQMAKAKDAGRPFCIQHNMVLPHTPILKTRIDSALNRAPSLDHMISYLDGEVGQLLSAIDSLGLTENTYVFFIGDNGTEVKTDRQTKAGTVTGGKWSLNDGGTHIPLIVYAPGRVPAGRIVDDLVEVSDFFPTFCALAGVSIPEEYVIDGISFAPLLFDQQAGERQWVTAGVKNDFFVFDGVWRLHHQGDQLYDCRGLPKEQLADTTSSEAKQAYQKLLPTLNALRKMRKLDGE